VIGVDTSGSFKNADEFLARMLNNNLSAKLKSYGQAGVQSLSKATPIETGETAHSWDFRIVENKGGPTIEWFNTHVNHGVNIAIIIQYGHGTGTGGWVPGIDYVNPAMGPVFNKIMDDFWKEVTK